MKLINPSVELWENVNNRTNNEMHIMKCAKVCYASDNSNIAPESAKKFIQDKIKAGHKSILRHGSVYYKIPMNVTEFAAIKNFVFNSPYCNSLYGPDKTDNNCLWISTNCQFIHDNSYFLNQVKEYESNFLEFYNNEHARELCRFTFCVITQISTSRELNRVSPNAICEQSTRYVNFDRKENGITICIPHWWYDCNDERKILWTDLCKASEKAYLELLAKGMSPQDARGVLPLDTATKCVYTYSIKEWRNILDLRYYGTTGKPHPNAKIVASKIREQLIDLGYEFRD